MSDQGPSSQGPPSNGLNVFPFASMAGGWLAPLTMFWLYVWGPLRPYRYPAGDLLPSASFGIVIAACITLWWCLPQRYFRVFEFERSGRFYERLGVKGFRRFAPDGEYANRWERRTKPDHRIIPNRQSAYDFLARTESSERGHIVLMMLGIVSAIYAWSLVWHGWALYLSAGNVLVNVYPILLQRYTRSRLHRILKIGLELGPGHNSA